MQTFKDTEGREWQLAINVAAVKRVRDLAEVDLLKSAEGRLLQQLADDPVKLCDVLWAIVQPQAQERKISDEQFGAALAGDVIDEATTAFLTELVAFFPRARRGLMNKVLAKLEKLTALTTAAVEKALDGDAMEKAVTARLQQAEKDLQAELSAGQKKPTRGGRST